MTTFDENSLTFNAKDPLDPNSNQAHQILGDTLSVPTSQGDVKIMIRPRYYLDGAPRPRNVGVRLSGGADSAIMLYMLALFKRDINPHITLYPSTSLNPTKPYQVMFAKQVINKVTELTGVSIGEHLWAECDGSSVERYRESQGEFINEIVPAYKLEVMFNAETMNPPETVPHLMTDGRDPARDGKTNRNGAVTFARNAYPFRNFNKAAVKEVYDYYGLTDVLFPLTRSCEKLTTNPADFAVHCGECWFCQEREWGFSRLV